MDKHLFSMKSISKTIAAFLLVSFSLIGSVGIVSAAPPPLDANHCYLKEGGDFTEISCPSPDTLGGPISCVVFTNTPGDGAARKEEIVDCQTAIAYSDNELGKMKCEDVASGGTWRAGAQQGDGTYNFYCECPDSLVVNDGICSTPEQADGSVDTSEAGTQSREGEESKAFEGDCETNGATELDKENCGIIKLLVNGINFMSALAGMAIVGSIMFAGYQYMTARDNSGQVEAAKSRIQWALIALGIFLFMFAFLNWLVPGGVL